MYICNYHNVDKHIHIQNCKSDMLYNSSTLLAVTRTLLDRHVCHTTAACSSNLYKCSGGAGTVFKEHVNTLKFDHWLDTFVLPAHGSSIL